MNRYSIATSIRAVCHPVRQREGRKRATLLAEGHSEGFLPDNAIDQQLQQNKKCAALKR